METCPMCRESKDKDQFYYEKSGKRQTYCKPCNLLHTQQRQRKFKYDCVQYKGGKCTMCGYNKCLNAMEFHHRDPYEKDFTIAQLRYTSFDKNPAVKQELDKCDLVCANCHREIHEKMVEFDRQKVVKPKAIYLCKCGKERGRAAKRCKECRILSLKPKPPKIEIPKVIAEPSFCECGEEKCSVSPRCQRCTSTRKRKIEWPSKRELKKLVWEIPTQQLAEKLGVSDNAIGKMCYRWGIDKPPRGYWAKNSVK